MFEFFQLRVAVCRQHFAVGIDVHVLPLGLLEQHAQIFQIVTGDQNGFTRHRTDIYRAG
ncbi:hypothetical protein D3C78_1883190 [compost metagenome]